MEQLVSVVFMHGLTSLKSSALYELRFEQTFEDIFKGISSGEISCGDGWLLDPKLVNLRVQSHVSKTAGFRIVSSTVGTAVGQSILEFHRTKVCPTSCASHTQLVKAIDEHQYR